MCANCSCVKVKILAVILAVIAIGLSSWTLKKVNDFSVKFAEEEADLRWIKQLLYKKLRDIPFKDDDK